jgi:transposase
VRGQRREETARFIAFRSHWRFDSEFCTPAEGHEKGGVEGEAGYFRRNHWVPVPKVVDLAELNRRLLDECRRDEVTNINHLQTVSLKTKDLNAGDLDATWTPKHRVRLFGLR